MQHAAQQMPLPVSQEPLFVHSFWAKTLWQFKRFGKGCLADAHVVKQAFKPENLDCFHWSLEDSLTSLLLTAFIPGKLLKIIVETEPLQNNLCLYACILTSLSNLVFGTNFISTECINTSLKQQSILH